MAHKLKNFIRQNDKIVLLVCDYYDTKQFPEDMIIQKGNLSLFPVANIPIIDYIISFLISHSLTNIILCGYNIKTVTKHIKETFSTKLNIHIHENETSLGQVLSYFNEVNFELKDMLILYSNHFTNCDLNILFEEHNKKKNLITFYLHSKESNDVTKHIYGLKDDKVVFYDKIQNDKINYKNIKNSLIENKTVEYFYKGCSPNMAVISPAVFKLFSDNFDYLNLSDLLGGVLAFNPFNLNIGYVDTNRIQSDKSIYNKEIQTLYDYYKFNKDCIKYKTVIGLERNNIINSNINIVEGNIINSIQRLTTKDTSIDNTRINNNIVICNTVIGFNNKLDTDTSIIDSFVGSGCTIKGNVVRCIIWDDINVSEDLEEIMVISNNQRINIYHLEIQEEEISEEVEKGSFYDDILIYLNEFVKGLDISKNKPDLNMEAVRKQIKIIKIIWNASNIDFMEAFVIFLIDLVVEEDMDGSTINASVFFPLLEGNVNSVDDQESLLRMLYDILLEGDTEYRKQVLFRYGYLLIEDGIILKRVLKKYNKMVKRGVF